MFAFEKHFQIIFFCVFPFLFWKFFEKVLIFVCVFSYWKESDFRYENNLFQKLIFLLLSHCKFMLNFIVKYWCKIASIKCTWIKTNQKSNSLCNKSSIWTVFVLVFSNTFFLGFVKFRSGPVQQFSKSQKSPGDILTLND